MKRNDRLFVLGNAEGRIVGLAAPNVPAEGEPSAGLVARSGQTVVEVSLPRELADLKSLVDVHKALLRFRLKDGLLIPMDAAAD